MLRVSFRTNRLDKHICNLPSHYKENNIDREDNNILRDVYNVMFPHKDIHVEHLSSSIKKYGTINIFKQQFGSAMAYRSKRSTGVLAAWAGTNGGICTNSSQQIVGLVDFYFSHSVKLDEHFSQFVFACVTWFQPSTETIFSELNPLVVACKGNAFPGGASRFYLYSELLENVALHYGKKMDNKLIL